MTYSKKVEFSFHFLGKIRLFQFSIFSKFQNLDFQGKKPENIGENPAEKDEYSFLCQNSETFIF